MGANYRRTRQRDAIRAVLDRARRPLLAHEVQMLAERDVPGIGLATVYRTLNRLADDGELSRVKLRSGGCRYEPATRSNGAFFLCEECERVVAVAGAPPTEVPDLPKGFQLHRQELTLIGVCAGCGRKQQSTPPQTSQVASLPPRAND